MLIDRIGLLFIKSSKAKRKWDQVSGLSLGMNVEVLREEQALTKDNNVF
jgi:hypothetical protein